MDTTLEFPERSRAPADTGGETLILSRAEIAALMAPGDWLDAVETGFRALGEGQAISPAPLHLPLKAGGLHGKGAVLAPAGLVAVKLNANVPENPIRRGLPTIQGALVLVDAIDGRLLAVMDSGELTVRRTAAASALAARYLARTDASRLALVGCGAQAMAQIEAIGAVRAVSDIRLWDRDPDRAEGLAERCGGRAVETLEEATAGAEIIVTCSSATEPFLDVAHVAPGAFVAAVGADAPSKSELTPALMARARVAADVREQALAMGDTRHAVAARAMPAGAIACDLAELVLGRHDGRAHGDEIWVFDSTGTGVQDVAAAAVVYARAVEAGVGLRVRLGT